MPIHKEIFNLAIQNEIMSQNLYKVLAHSFTANPDVSKILLGLIPMEKIHEEKLRKAFQKEFPGAKPEVDTNLSHLVKPTDIDEPGKALEFAISREVIATEIYAKMAASATDPDLVEFLKSLAAEEEFHRIVLETEILRIDNQMTWYDPSELNGMVED
jgi:rubrerythrin